MKYFLGIKVARSKKGILLSQRKCILDLHSKVVMLECMSIGSPINVNAKLLPTQEEFLGDVGRYKGLVEDLNYRTVITYHIRSQYSKLVFISTADYPLEGGTEDFKVPEESSREKASLVKSGIHSSSKLLRCRLGSVLL